MGHKLYKTSCLCLQTRRADRVLTQLYDSFIKRAGMKSTQYCLLRCIKNLNEPCLGDISLALCMDQTTVSRNISKLEQKGLITTYHPDSDPRKINIQITALGHARLDIAKTAWEEAQSSVKAQIGERDFEQLYNLMGRIAEKLG